jgi:hypothetical protein
VFRSRAIFATGVRTIHTKAPNFLQITSKPNPIYHFQALFSAQQSELDAAKAHFPRK